MSDAIESAIEDSASGPLRVRGDEGEIQQHSLKDLIEADKYLTQKTASSNRLAGIRRVKMRSPGAG